MISDETFYGLVHTNYKNNLNRMKDRYKTNNHVTLAMHEVRKKRRCLRCRDFIRTTTYQRVCSTCDILNNKASIRAVNLPWGGKHDI